MHLRSSRSSFLIGSSAALAAPALVPSRARAAQFSFKVGNPDSVDFPVTVRLVQFAQAVKAETGGRFELQVYPNSTLGSTTSMLSQMRIGSLQFVVMNYSLFGSVVPLSQINSLGFAFTSDAQATAAFDGALGAYIRRDFAQKGIFVFPNTWETGFKQVSTSLKPIRTVDDFAGLKLRVLPAAMVVELFRALGASPTPLDSNETYTGLQTKIIDGCDDSLASIEGHRLYEVLKYIAITNHSWSGYWFAANADAWKALPDDIQSVIARNAAKFGPLERRDIGVYTDSIIDKLKRQGIAFTPTDPQAIRARLGAYYARWKAEFGSTAWSLLEGAVGKLG